MRSAWHVITVMALANLIAIVGFVWWLHFSGRIDGDRVETIRAMLAEPIDAERARKNAEAAEAEAEHERQAEIRQMSGPPVSASEALSLRIETSEIDLQRIQRLNREVRDLTATLSRERRELDREREAFEKMRAAFEAMREEIARIEGDEQFAKSVGVLESLRPADAKQTLLELIDSDRAQVVAYLNAMKARQRSKVMTEFVKDGQADLAAELLEEIRLRGLVAAEP